MQRLLVITLLLSSLMATNAIAQLCNPKIKASTPSERFLDKGNGIVLDTKSGLEWSRCSIGQEWKSDTCTGDAQPLLWSVARLIATTTEISAGENKWRLPEHNELSNLVEFQCAQPAINSEIFPATPSAAFWTGTRYANKDGSFWQVQFVLGKSFPERGDYNAFVRLVRDPAVTK